MTYVQFFFYYHKAFDSVPCRPLVVKLRSHGLDDCIINWIKNYLAERTQVVAVDGVESDPLPVLSEDPQGSVLGPLLFLLPTTGCYPRYTVIPESLCWRCSTLSNCYVCSWFSLSSRSDWMHWVDTNWVGLPKSYACTGFAVQEILWPSSPGFFEAALPLSGTAPFGICLPSVGSSSIKGQGCFGESPKISLQTCNFKMGQKLYMRSC